MVHRASYLDGEEVQIQMDRDGMVQLSLGPVSVGLSLDFAYDLQYNLATFLAEVEQYEMNDTKECHSSSESLDGPGIARPIPLFENPVR